MNAVLGLSIETKKQVYVMMRDFRPSKQIVLCSPPEHVWHLRPFTDGVVHAERSAATTIELAMGNLQS